MTNSNYLDARTPEERANEPETVLTMTNDFTMSDADEAQHEVDKQNDLLNDHFEAQRIQDLKVDVDAVLDKILRETVVYAVCDGSEAPDCAGCRLVRLSEDLKWYKELL